MQDGLAVQANKLLPAHLGKGYQELEQGVRSSPASAPMSHMERAMRTWGVYSWRGGGGRHLVHDGNISCVGPEAIVHRDKGQALSVVGERLP